MKPKVKYLPSSEREFTATIADDESSWHVATASLKYTGKLKKLGWVPVRTDESGYSFFEVPRRCISFRSFAPSAKKSMQNPSKAALLKTIPTSPGASTEANTKSKSQRGTQGRVAQK